MKFIIIVPISLTMVMLAMLGFYNLTHQPLKEIKIEPYNADFEFVDLEIEETIKTISCGKHSSFTTYSKTHVTHYLNGITIKKHPNANTEISLEL